MSLRPRSTESLPALGVDIGSGMVKAAQATSIAGRIDITATASFAIDPNTLEDGVIKDPRRFGRILAGNLQLAGVGPSATVVSVPSHLAALRWVQLPGLDGEELREAAKFKAKRHLPFDIDSAYIEATAPILEEGETVGPSLVIAVPRAVIDSRAEAIEAAGQVPVAAELEAQALLRVVERRMNQKSALWRDASLTIIDVGANNTHMYVVQNQQLQFIRGVKFGSNRIAEVLSHELEVPLHEANELMAQPTTELWAEGICKVKVGDVFKFVTVTAELEKLVREFLRLLRYFRSLHPERSYAGILDHVLICGGLSSMPGFAEYLQASLELRVERATPFAGMIANLNGESFRNIAANQEAYTVVVGLALSGLHTRRDQRRERHARHEFNWTRAA